MKIKSIIFLFLISLFSYSQEINIDIKKSEIFKDKKKHTNLLFSESDGEGGLIVVRGINMDYKSYSKKYLIEIFDSNLNKISSFVLENRDRGILKGILIKNGTINLIQLINSIKREKGVEVSILSSPINILNFSKKVLFNIDYKEYSTLFGHHQISKSFSGEVTFSSNKKFLVFDFDMKNKKEETHLLKVFNDDFKELYNTTFVSDIKDRFFEYENIDLSEVDGSIFLLGKVFENNSKKTKKKGKTNYHYELYKLNDGAKKQINFKEENLFVNSLHVLHTENNLNLVGFYGERSDYRIKGVCRYNLNPIELTITNKSFAPFNDHFFEDKYKSKAKTKRKRKEITNIDYRGVFLDEQDNIIINAEEFYITSYYVSNGNGGGHWRTIYHYDDIISVKIDKKGDLVWARNINKTQTNTLNASYTSTIANNEVYFYLNTSDKIKKLSNERIGFKQTSTKRSNLYVIKIAENGDFTYKKLIDDKDSKVWYSVNNGIVSEDLKAVIFQGKKGKNKQIIKLTIQ